MPIHYLDPFAIYHPDESGMSNSETEDVAKVAASFHTAVSQFINTGVDPDCIDDRLREMGIEPSDYWSGVINSIDEMASDNLTLNDFEVLPSGLVVPS